MSYTIKEATKRSKISEHTIRYYDKEGLLPFIERSSNGRRMFRDSDLSLIFIIKCMKKSGMSLEMIKHYVECCMKGDSTLHERMEIVKEHQRILLKKKQELDELLYVAEHKVLYYEQAIAQGSENNVSPMVCFGNNNIKVLHEISYNAKDFEATS